MRPPGMITIMLIITVMPTVKVLDMVTVTVMVMPAVGPVRGPGAPKIPEAHQTPQLLLRSAFKFRFIPVVCAQRGGMGQLDTAGPRY